MRTDDLIADLARRATPVRPLPAPGLRALTWLAVAILSGAAGIVVFGARTGLADLARDPDFLVPGGLAMVTAWIAVTAALVLAVPGAERSPLLRRVTVALVALWGLVLVSAIARAGNGLTGTSHWWICFARVLLIGLVPGVVLFAMLRRAAPLRPVWTASLAMAAAIAAGALAIQFICPLTDAAHALFGHFAPVIALGALGALTGKRLLTLPRVDIR